MESGTRPYETDEESGSAYEISSDDQVSVDSDHPPSRAGSVGSKDRGRPRNRKIQSLIDDSHNDTPAAAKPSSSKFDNVDWIREDSLRFAATFEPPESLAQIRSPQRHTSGGSRAPSAKRKASIPPAIRAKRARGHSNKKYRELLNVEIRDAVARAIPEDDGPLLDNQIGSSIWTAEEQHFFFSSLSRLGKDNVRDIAARIGSKSELEVQQYMQLLQRRREELGADADWKNRFLRLTDYPAAVEINEECSAALEKAADVLASEQERHEEQREAAKWGADSWLLTHKLAKDIDRDIRAAAADGEEYADMPPALDLLNLRRWLELSGRVFMNAAEPEEDNWRSIAEEGEMPAIRATAFEDFHSLAVNLTKRLVSTSLWYSMSRRKARNLTNTKHGDVSKQDVEAAVKTLNLTANTKDFWAALPRRRKCFVIDDEQGEDSDDDVEMSYDEVEAALGKEPVSNDRVRERSQSQASAAFESDRDGRTNSEDLTESQLEADADTDHNSNDDSFSSMDDDIPDIDNTDAIPSTARNLESQMKRLETRQANERAHAAYVEAYDAQDSRTEEERLWEIIGKQPSGVKDEPMDMDRPNVGGLETGGTGDWRGKMEFWSEWEMVAGGIPEVEFERNRAVMEQNKAKRAVRRSTRGTVDLGYSREETLPEESGEEEDGRDASDSERESGPDEGGMLEEDNDTSAPEDALSGSDNNNRLPLHQPEPKDGERSDDDISFRGDDDDD